MVPTRMVEVMPAMAPASAVAGARILVGDLMIELPPAMAPADIGRVARAVCAPC